MKNKNKIIVFALIFLVAIIAIYTLKNKYIVCGYVWEKTGKCSSLICQKIPVGGSGGLYDPVWWGVDCIPLSPSQIFSNIYWAIHN